MKNLVLMATLFAIPLALSACDKPAGAPKAEPQAQANAMDDMAMSAETKVAKGSGTVAAVDMATGKITLDHGPIAELEWPAMKMGFAAKPELLTGMAVGDQVDFTLSLKGNDGTVTAIAKQTR